MHSRCRICQADVQKQDGEWEHTHSSTDHRATPMHTGTWPTEGVVGPFEDEYKFLCNFYEVDVEYNGVTFPSSEHAYQATKVRDDPELYEQIATADSPDEAKRLGGQATLSPTWDDRKKYVMLEVVTAKFTQHPALRTKLLETGNQTLVELNWWDDTYWGADVETGEGRNMLGRILMHVRSTLRSLRI